MAAKKVCDVDGCDKPARSIGLCPAHYTRKRRHGDAIAGGQPRTASDWLAKHVEHDGDACLVWPFHRTKRGYPIIYNGSFNTTASRVMCEAVNGPPAHEWYEAAHTCGNGHGGCINPRHLKWSTPSANRMDKIRHGTDGRGSKNAQSKLTENDVHMIRSMNGTATISAIAKRYGVSSGQISRIISRTDWSWLADRQNSGNSA